MQLFSKTFRCPDLVSQQDAIVVEETLQNAPGIEAIEVDHVTHTVTVTTADQGGVEAIAWMLKDAGFPAWDESVRR
jgi:hypothetical protein